MPETVCSSLSDLKPLEKWDVSKCTDFSDMFGECPLLSDLKPIKNWNVSKCIDFNLMFYECSDSLDKNQLSQWCKLNDKFVIND